MRIEEQVLTIEQMQHLKELGLAVKDTALCWTEVVDDYGESSFDLVRLDMLCEVDLLVEDYTPTLTLQEILEMLPDHIIYDGKYEELIMNFNECGICYREYGSDKILKSYAFMGKKIKAAYKMLCWVAENGYLNKE